MGRLEVRAQPGHPARSPRAGQDGDRAAGPEGCKQGPELGEPAASVPSARLPPAETPSAVGAWLRWAAAEHRRREKAGAAGMGAEPRPGKSVSCCMSVTYSSISRTQSRPGLSSRSVCFFTNYCGPAALFVDTVVLKSANVHLSGGRARDSH